MLKLFIDTISLRAISSISTLAFTFISTRFYGLSDLGDFAFFLSLVTFCSLINGFGIIIPFFIIFDKQKISEKKSYYNYLSKFQSFISLIISSIALIFLFLIKIDNIILIVLTSFFIPKILINAYTLRSLGSTNNFIFFQQGNIHFFGLPFLLVFNIYQIDNPIILSYFFGCITHFIFSKYFIFRKFSNLNLSSSSIDINTSVFFKSSSSFLILDILSYCSNWVPVFILSFLMNSEAVGVYYNIIKIGSVFLVLLFIIESILLKDLRSLASNFSEKILSQIIKVKNNVAYLGLGVFFVYIIFGVYILNAINPELSIYKTPLFIYSFIRVINLIFGPQSLFMKLSENQKTMKSILLVSTSINIFLSFTLVPIFGINGVFYAIFISNLLWCIMVRNFIYKSFNFSF